ncbi:MAG TPA: protein kinase [Gemmataceae bacterium]|nr:protein kinase [Gemmataceae bacterium]
MPETVTHPTPQVLTAFVKGRLAQTAAASVSRHLERCSTCRQAVARLSPGRGATQVGGVASAVAAAPASPPLSLPPELVNHPKYRIVRELGRGGMGVVYQAVQTLMDRPVAIKVINPSLLEHGEALPRFQAEVKAAAKLDHPNIVRAYDADQVGPLHLLVMEFVEGMNLADVVQQKGPLPVAHACHYIRQAALGLQHAFEQGMTHRDIKPHNLMLAPRGVVKILDFGLARLRSGQRRDTGLTASGSFMGTPDYVAPEQATDARTADTRSDLYSLGGTLYHLLAARPPFQEETTVKLVLAHLEKEPLPLHTVRPDVPAALSAVVSRLLAKDPGQRYQTPVEVAQALVPFIKAGATATPVMVASAAAAASPARKTVTGGDTSRLKNVRSSAGAEDEAVLCAEVIDDVEPPGIKPQTNWPILAGVAGGAVAILALGVGALAALGQWPFTPRHENPPAPTQTVASTPEVPKPVRLSGSPQEEDAISQAKQVLFLYQEPGQVQARQQEHAKEMRDSVRAVRAELKEGFNRKFDAADATYRQRVRASKSKTLLQNIRAWDRGVSRWRAECTQRAVRLTLIYAADLQAAFTRHEQFISSQFAEVSNVEEEARRQKSNHTWKHIAELYAQIIPTADQALQTAQQEAAKRLTLGKEDFAKAVDSYLEQFVQRIETPPAQPTEDTETPEPAQDTAKAAPKPSSHARNSRRTRNSAAHHTSPAPPPPKLDTEAEAQKEYDKANYLYRSSLNDSGSVPDRILDQVRTRYKQLIKNYPNTKAAEEAKKELNRISQ